MKSGVGIKIIKSNNFLYFYIISHVVDAYKNRLLKGNEGGGGGSEYINKNGGVC